MSPAPRQTETSLGAWTLDHSGLGQRARRSLWAAPGEVKPQVEAISAEAGVAGLWTAVRRKL